MDVSDASLTVLVWHQFGLHLRQPSQTRKQANAICLLSDQCHAKPPRPLYLPAWGYGQHTVAQLLSAHNWPEQRIADYESHLHIIKGLEWLRKWLRNRHLVEAMAEWRHLQLHWGSLDRLPFLRSYEDQRPGNKGQLYSSRSIHSNEIEPTPQNVP